MLSIGDSFKSVGIAAYFRRIPLVAIYQYQMFELPTAVLLISVLLLWGSPLRFVIVSDIP